MEKNIKIFFIIIFILYSLTACFKRPVIRSNVYVGLGDKGVCFLFKNEHVINEINFYEDGKIFGTFRDYSNRKKNQIEVDKSYVGYKLHFKTNLLYQFSVETNKGPLWGYFIILDVSEPKKITEINFKHKSKDLKIFNCDMWEELN
jgi:hypothetical protein